VRELRNVIERAVILSHSDFLETEHLPPDMPGGRAPSASPEALTPGMSVEQAERRLIEVTLVHTRNNKTRAAEILGITTRTLQNKLKRFGRRGEDPVLS
jgi:DNA-binding NtrC family response regulator